MWDMKLSLLRYSVIHLFILGSLAACTSPPDEGSGTSTTQLSNERVMYCGGVTGLGCENDDEKCYYAPAARCGTGVMYGTCQKPAEVCPAVDEPVCGCNLRTYANSCEASRARVSVYAAGPCPPDARIVPIDRICPHDGDTVCGTDGKEYPNACYAETAGQPIAFVGRCPRKDGSCGGKFGDMCAPTQFCDFKADAICGWADATGKCKPRPQFCTADDQKVCGCDGKTYSNRCIANAAGTAVLTDAPCR